MTVASAPTIMRALGGVSIAIPEILADHPRLDEALATAITMQTQRESAVIYPREGAPHVYWGSKQYLRLPPDAPLAGSLVVHSHALFSGVGDAGPSPEDVSRVWEAGATALFLRERHALWVIAFPSPLTEHHHRILDGWLQRDDDAIQRHHYHLLGLITTMALQRLGLPFTLTRTREGKLGVAP